MTARPCLWCDGPFTPRTTGGKRQRFCSEQCRRDFDSGLRAWAAHAVSFGLLPVSALKDALKQRARCVEARFGLDATHDTGQATTPNLGAPTARHVSV